MIDRLKRDDRERYYLSCDNTEDYDTNTAWKKSNMKTSISCRSNRKILEKYQSKNIIRN